MNSEETAGEDKSGIMVRERTRVASWLGKASNGQDSSAGLNRTPGTLHDTSIHRERLEYNSKGGYSVGRTGGCDGGDAVTVRLWI